MNRYAILDAWNEMADIDAHLAAEFEAKASRARISLIRRWYARRAVEIRLEEALFRSLLWLGEWGREP